MYEICYRVRPDSAWIIIHCDEVASVIAWSERLLLDGLYELRVKNAMLIKPYRVQTFVGDYKVLDEGFSEVETAASYARSFEGKWTNHVPDGLSHQYTSASVFYNGLLIHEKHFAVDASVSRGGQSS